MPSSFIHYLPPPPSSFFLPSPSSSLISFLIPSLFFSPLHTITSSLCFHPPLPLICLFFSSVFSAIFFLPDYFFLFNTPLLPFPPSLHFPAPIPYLLPLLSSLLLLPTYISLSSPFFILNSTHVIPLPSVTLLNLLPSPYFPKFPPPILSVLSPPLPSFLPPLPTSFVITPRFFLFSPFVLHLCPGSQLFLSLLHTLKVSHLYFLFAQVILLPFSDL